MERKSQLLSISVRLEIGAAEFTTVELYERFVSGQHARETHVKEGFDEIF
jgi:hypothetical protein